jgi:hypothetical protein
MFFNGPLARTKGATDAYGTRVVCSSSAFWTSGTRRITTVISLRRSSWASWRPCCQTGTAWCPVFTSCADSFGVPCTMLLTRRTAPYCTCVGSRTAATCTLRRISSLHSQTTSAPAAAPPVLSASQPYAPHSLSSTGQGCLLHEAVVRCTLLKRCAWGTEHTLQCLHMPPRCFSVCGLRVWHTTRRAYERPL